MPLVDSGESSIDKDLTKRFKELFSSFQNGLILDDSGRCWMLWSLVELERWWSLFESNVAIPFGRKLFNSCCDEEEFQISQDGICKSGWFKKSNNRRNLVERWNLFGWGIIDIELRKMSTGLPSSFAAGFALASIESYNQSRFKSEWKQINQTEIYLELTPDDKTLPLAKKHTQLPWSAGIDNSIQKDISFDLESRNLGWSVEGEPMVILPVSLFSRLFHSTIGLTMSLNNELIESWTITGLDERFRKTLIVAAHSTFQLFIDSDKHVFAESIDSWKVLIEFYCQQWGWGNALKIEKINEMGGVSVKFEANHTMPFFIGQVMGIWQRSYGRKPKISLSFDGDFATLVIDSLLDYN